MNKQEQRSSETRKKCGDNCSTEIRDDETNND